MINSKNIQDLLRKGKKLGKGAYGSVYNVNYKGREMVMKIPNQFWGKPFKEEVKALTELEGAGGAPKLFEYSHDPVVIFMEKCSGQEYFEALRNGRVSPNLLFKALPEIARKLNEIHDKGFIHVDFKAENIMFDVKNNGRIIVRIIDYGLSRKKGEFIKFDNPSSIYPPEYSTGAFADPASDVYSLGCLIEKVAKSLSVDLYDVARAAKRDRREDRPTLFQIIEELEKKEFKIIDPELLQEGSTAS